MHHADSRPLTYCKLEAVFTFDVRYEDLIPKCSLSKISTVNHKSNQKQAAHKGALGPLSMVAGGRPATVALAAVPFAASQHRTLYRSLRAALPLRPRALPLPPAAAAAASAGVTSPPSRRFGRAARGSTRCSSASIAE